MESARVKGVRKHTIRLNVAVSFFLSLLIVTLPSLRLSGQVKQIRLWQDRIPGAIDSKSYKTDTVVIEGDRLRLRKITDPVLDFYPPPAHTSNGTAIIICPGGGYRRLAIDNEGSDIAQWLNGLGISAFVLKYRLPSDAIMEDKTIGPLQDGQRAVRLVRQHAAEWMIDPHKIGIMGFSAGGHLASMVSTCFSEQTYASSDTTSARPDFSVLVYPVISMDPAITHPGSRDSLIGPHPSQVMITRFSSQLRVTDATPPTFIVHASNDGTVPVQNSIEYYLALKKHGVAGELHIYETGHHGFGLGKDGGTEAQWPEACKRWLRARGMISH